MLYSKISSASSIIGLLSFALLQASTAFSPALSSSSRNTLKFGIASAFKPYSSSCLSMTVIPDGQGSNEREGTNHQQTDSDNISSFQDGQPSGIPHDMILHSACFENDSEN
jgi:hypothetical protein